jgi:hypothetical protein
MSGELPILWRRPPDHTVAVFYESGPPGRFRVAVWHKSGLTATVWFRANHEPTWGVDSEDMDIIEDHVTTILNDLDLAAGDLQQ